MQTQHAGTSRLAIAIGLILVGANVQATTLPSNDVFINAWESNTQSSFNGDVGVDVNTFYNEVLAGGNLTFPLDPSFQTWVNNALNAGGAITFNIAGVNQTASPKNTTLDSLLVSSEPQLGGYFSATAGNTPVNYSTFSTDQTHFVQRVGGINLTGTGVVPSDTTSQGESAFYNANYVPWNNYEDLSPSINASSTLGKGGLNDLVLEYINTTGASTLKTSTPMNLTLLPGSFSISSDHSSLVWTSTVSTVPVPGSLGLFISGLLGLWKLQQRKR